jgi:Flp pilus assembly protein TadD
MLVAACATVPGPQPENLFDDSLFAPPSVRVGTNDIFAVSPAMKRYIGADIAESVRIEGPQRGLFDALYSRHQLQLEYDSMTRNASEAFTARAGNCLSLVIMTAAFAKEMGLAVTYRQIYADEAWSRTDDIYLAVGHVNLTLGMKSSDVGLEYYRGDRLTIDFLPPSDVRGLHSRTIGEKTIVAMYLNNRAVESMVARRLDDAYWFAREAIIQEPDFTSSYNTLGAVYWRHGDLRRAEATLRYALVREPKNTKTMSNLVPVLMTLGNTAEANELGRLLAQLDPHPAFSYFDRGIVAMRTGDYRLAKEMFAKEVARAPYYHEFHYWLAAACVGLGEYESAREQMTLAMESSPSRVARGLYAAKLEKLEALRSK